MVYRDFGNSILFVQNNSTSGIRYKFLGMTTQRSRPQITDSPVDGTEEATLLVNQLYTLEQQTRNANQHCVARHNEMATIFLESCILIG